MEEERYICTLLKITKKINVINGDGVPVPSTLKPAVGLHVGFKELELSLLREVTHLKTNKDIKLYKVK
jgi:hypothetical protein